MPAAPARSSSRTASIRSNKAWLVAGAALLNRCNSRRAEAETPPAGKFVEVGGVSLHYVDRGEGPAVVLLHGNGVSYQDFELSGLLGLAAAGHRVIAFDRPGFGYSDRPRSAIWTPSTQAALIAGALKQIGVERAVIVGHSWGTLVALAMALDHAGPVAGLVLLSGYYYGTARPDALAAAIPAIPLFGDVIAHTTAPMTALLTGPAAVKASFAPAPIPERFADFPAGLALRPSQIRATAADSALMMPGAIALSRRYGEISMPVIVIAGDGDRIVDMKTHSARLAGDIPRAELRVVANQGHFLHWFVPDEVVAAIDDVGLNPD